MVERQLPKLDTRVRFPSPACSLFTLTPTIARISLDIIMKPNLIRLFVLALATILFASCATQPAQTTTTTTTTEKTHGYFR